MKKKVLKLLTLLFVFSLSLSLTGCDDSIDSIDELKGKKIGIVTDTIYEDIIFDIVKDPVIVHYDLPIDMINGLLNKEIDAYAYDEIVCNFYTEDNRFVNYISLPDYRYECGYVIPKVDEKIYLKDELNEFIRDVKLNGELIKMQTKWLSDDKSVRVSHDFNSLPGTRGTLTFVGSPSDAPMSYRENDKNYGYDLDVLYLFCEKYGYKANIILTDFDTELDMIDNNEADLGFGNIFITDERKEKYYMTDSVFQSYASIGVYYDISNSSNKKFYNKISDLKYKTIGIIKGTFHDNVAVDHIDGCKLKYYETLNDITNALKKKEIDAFIEDEAIARYTVNKTNNYRIIDRLITYEEYGIAFNKDTEFSKKIKNEFNEFLKEIKNNGEYEELDSIWIGNVEGANKVIDYKSLPNINGTIRMSIAADVGEPFDYALDDNYVGYDVDMVYRFCKKYGYALNITSIPYSEMFTRIQNNEFDIGACCISITDDRKKIVDFSEPNYLGGLVLVVNK